MTALHTDKPEGGEKQIPIEEIPTTGIVGNEAAEQQAKEMYILARKDCADDCIFVRFMIMIKNMKVNVAVACWRSPHNQ